MGTEFRFYKMKSVPNTDGGVASIAIVNAFDIYELHTKKYTHI